MIVVTGANGNLGKRLLADLTRRGAAPLRAIVRSERAAEQIRRLELTPAPEVCIVDYLDDDAMAGALDGAQGIVHLVGILKESRANRYRDAHEGAAEVLARVAARVAARRIVYLSIVGADAASPNACLASRGRAEALLRGGATATVVIRVPMVLGEGDYAARALAGRARRRWNVLLRGASLEQPIYAGDVIDAICAALAPETPATAGVLDLAGPTSLSRAELTRRAARVLARVPGREGATPGGGTRIVSLPVSVGMAAAWLLERLTANPPVTRAMLGVLDHDDAVDPAPACERLGIRLTRLDETLARVLSA